MGQDHPHADLRHGPRDVPWERCNCSASLASRRGSPKPGASGPRPARCWDGNHGSRAALRSAESRRFQNLAAGSGGGTPPRSRCPRMPLRNSPHGFWSVMQRRDHPPPGPSTRQTEGRIELHTELHLQAQPGRTGAGADQPTPVLDVDLAPLTKRAGDAAVTDSIAQALALRMGLDVVASRMDGQFVRAPPQRAAPGRAAVDTNRALLAMETSHRGCLEPDQARGPATIRPEGGIPGLEPTVVDHQAAPLLDEGPTKNTRRG